MMKTCTKCHVAQSEDAFYLRKRRRRRVPDGQRGTHCKACMKAKSAEWRSMYRTREVIERHNATAREQRARIRTATFAAYGGFVCVCCGETEPTFLTLDHIENDGAAFRRAAFGARNKAGYRTYAWLAKRGFPPGIQVMCMNCQFGKRMNAGVCPHQVTRNDHPRVGVEPSGSKRSTASLLKLVG